ncbi:MAG: hypothetical protein LBB05_03040 [Puniceicoccales bacterium]|jgi:hypothetical protein|nr:hypothetical protein [Puniceicoccales bacterium]
MLKNKNIIVRSAFLALGLCGNHVYGSADLTTPEEKLWDDVRCLWGSESGLQEELEDLTKRFRECGNYGYKNKKGRTFLYGANCPEVLEFLISLGTIDIDSQDNRGHTALHYHVGCTCDYLVQCDFYEESESEMENKDARTCSEIKVLIDGGANPFLRNLKGETPRKFLENLRNYWRDEVPAEDKGGAPERRLSVLEKAIQMLRDAERKWAAAHPEWMAAHPECVVE